MGLGSDGNREPPFSAIANTVTKKLVVIYYRASMPLNKHVSSVPHDYKKQWKT